MDKKSAQVEDEKSKTEEFDIKEIYTPLSVAKEEIWRRWNDKELRKKVEDFLGDDIPEVFKDGPKATLVRHIASPNLELLYFLELIKECGMDYVLSEFKEDKFVDKNIDKYHLCKLFFYNGIGKRWGEKVEPQTIVDFQISRGKKICDINTLSGESLVDFHHKMLFNIIPKNKRKIFDISQWFFRKGPLAKNYYLYYLSLFVCHGVLFENFSLKGNSSDNKFTREIVIPSIKKIIEIFKIKPIIVPVSPLESELFPNWYYYPDKLRELKK